MSIKALQSYISYAKYAKYLPEKDRRETWEEQVDRVFDMHFTKYESLILDNVEFAEAFQFAKQMVKDRMVLGSQRSLQFGGPGILKHNAKIYNCVTSWVDRPKFFSEFMYMLLCGCGAGFSVQGRHINKLPDIGARSADDIMIFSVQDSIEGWADAIHAVMSSFFVTKDEFSGLKLQFDYSLVRPEGAHISGGFKAPGPAGLKRAIENIEIIVKRRLAEGETRLRSIDVYDCCMHIADAVLSGGVRRSATICLFDAWDMEMASAKTGDWFTTNKQRARSNNSAVLIKGETKREVFDALINEVRSFGEPGFIWLDDPDILFNPCSEIGFYPSFEGKSGWQGCNLTEINGKKSKTEEEFFAQCKASAIIGTLQAGYTGFTYLDPITKKIFEKEALLGCSITGMMENPEILFNKRIQRAGATVIKQWNAKVAEWMGINRAARTTCIKPAGTTSLLLGTSSGVHPHHAKRYIRTVEANKLEFPAKLFQGINPLAVEDSVWSASGTDVKLSFLCEVPQGSVTKNQMGAVELLKNVQLTQQNWVESGTQIEFCTKPYIRHNVSNTITVKDDEWDAVADYIWDNQQFLAGVALLSYSGDKDYYQAPNQTVLNAAELVKEYGDASVLASGLIVDGLHVFKNLWDACDFVLGNKQFPAELNVEAQRDWIRRAIQFADRYFEGNIKKMTYCLKDVSNWKKWLDLKRTYKEIDWSVVMESQPDYVNIDTMGAVACAGGQCEI